MFDLTSLIEFMKIEPGHGFIQSILLFMIWWQSKGLRKEMANFKDGLAETKNAANQRFDKIEGRITVLEMKG